MKMNEEELRNFNYLNDIIEEAKSNLKEFQISIFKKYSKFKEGDFVEFEKQTWKIEGFYFSASEGFHPKYHLKRVHKKTKRNLGYTKYIEEGRLKPYCF